VGRGGGDFRLGGGVHGVPFKAKRPIGPLFHHSMAMKWHDYCKFRITVMRDGP
jgi:hypothetical protein